MTQTIEEIEARRSARKAEIAKQRAVQLAVDLEALDALEVEHGDGSVRRVDVERFTPGMPTLVVVRAPTRAEFKRYQDGCKGIGGQKGDALAAANLICETCLVYPSREDFAKLLEVSPGIQAIAGVAAVELSAGKAAEEGKG